ncbi:hypothetical protein ACQ4PT_042310 [Festuca glaucescens]
MIPCLTIGPKIIVANEMEKMREDLKEITDQHEKFKFVEGTNTNEPKVTHIRETSSTLEAQIIGRSDEKGEILASLIDRMTEDITVLPIYGIGGIGKTTLAKMVYNSSHFKEYAQVWVYVSQKFDWKAIGNSIISQLAEKEERKHTKMQMIHNSLEKILDNKKILIVLDDLWEGDESRLEILMDMLRVGKGGNVVVLVTKHDEGIAKKISTIQPYKLAPLTDEMCWSIIRQKSAFESRGNKEQLEHIRKDIALKCAGVALAAKSLGHMLKSMKFREWESVRDSDIWNVSSLKDASSAHVLASLKLSYSVMPSYLKLCFAYCAIFPKGHKIVKDDLIHQWVSLGFSNWQFSEKYISQHLGLSFLEHSKSPSFSFKKYLKIMIPCLTIGPKIIVANEMEKMREDLKEITDQHEKFKFVEGTNTNEPKVTHIRETSSTLEAQIIGRSDEKGEILASLIDRMTEDITVLPIYGIGGIGKTTLAKMVYNSSHFKEYAQVWVYVSQKFDWKAIGNSIISQLAEKEERKHTEMQMIHNSLEKILDNKKILIVLDDLWEGDESRLEILMDMLRVGKGGNVVVLVTKRDEGIAKKISTIQPYKLAPLTDEMCWSIIRQKSAFESRGNKEQLEHIGKDIALKCAGVALAAKSLGHMLKSMKFREWESVRDSDIWNVSSLKDASSAHVLASLKLSYSVMPSYLKLCFAYCAIFPKGHKIVKDDLIHQWVSLGFSNWQFSEKYISQRLGLSFLEHSKSPSTIKLYDEDITLLTMHDLVHDLARSVMDDEILVSGKGDSIEGSCYHYALLDDCSKPLGMESSKIRALRFVHCDKIKIHDVLFSSNKSLRVLDLSECSMHKLPDSIGVLKQLRYLNAPRVQDATIPNSITWLSKLMYLSLRGSPAILALPKSIGEIEHLVYLDLSDCSRIEKLPESSGRLKELVHLIFQIALALEVYRHSWAASQNWNI